MKLTHRVLKFLNDKTGYDPHPPLEQPEPPTQLFYPPKKVAVYKCSFTETRPMNHSDREAVMQKLARDLAMTIYQNGGIQFEQGIDELNGDYKVTAQLAVVEEDK